MSNEEKQAAPAVPVGNDPAWTLAAKVREALDRKACPGYYMDVAVEAVVHNYATAAPSQEPAHCTNSDTWNCKYCRKTEGCEAPNDPRNFAAPSQPAVPSRLLQKLDASIKWLESGEVLPGTSACIGLDDIKTIRATLAAAPSQERCCTCGYLTSEREHLGCLRKAVKDLDAATGGPYPSQPVTRPQNCGTSYCSCIECVCEPSQPVTLTDDDIARCINVATCGRPFIGLMNPGGVPSAFSRSLADLLIAALREKEAKATP